jgi:hypothetical protein
VDKDWVFEIVQDRLGDNQLRIALLRDFIDETQSVVCNYLNRSYVPEPLKYVIVNLTMDLLKSQALNGMINNDQLADAGIGAFASIKDGDSELKFATSKTITGAHTADVDALLYNYTSQLDKYRLLKW